MTNILSEIVLPATAARLAPAPAQLADSPAWPAVAQRTNAGQLYLHQAEALDLYYQGANVVISTDTASGKSLVFQAATVSDLAQNTQDTAIAIYPVKALSRDQLKSWREFALAAGIPPEQVNRIDGDITDIAQRRQILMTSRIVIMTPDIIQQWLLAYSSQPYAKRTLRQDLREVQNNQYNIRRFLANLTHLIIDEAHTYDGAFGTHFVYLMQRLQQKRAEVMQPHRPIRIFAASATIANPAQHLQTITGQDFAVVDQSRNGAPKAELTVQHAIARPAQSGGHLDLQHAIEDIIRDDPGAYYIAFIDDRQIAERCAAAVEAAHSLTEPAIIRESTQSMSYRSGLMERESIEDSLRNHSIRGLASTSALELGIDIPDLSVGLNLGLPSSIQRLKQRAGRIGRRSPGRFMIMAPADALKYHDDDLYSYWSHPVEGARLYPDNPIIRNTHSRCLQKETDLNKPPKNAKPDQTDEWAEQLPPPLQELATGAHNDPQYVTGDPNHPHRNDIRDAADTRVRIIQKISQEESLITSETTRREAAKDAYPMATYWHAKQSYQVQNWQQPDPPAAITITVQHAPPRDTRPIVTTGASITLSQPRISEHGHIEYANHLNTIAWESITGYLLYDDETAEWTQHSYHDANIDRILTERPTTATILIIWQDWFRHAATRHQVARALHDAVCSIESIHPSDLRTTHQNVRIHRNKWRDIEPAIVLWDRISGGLGISSLLDENLTKYTKAILEAVQHHPDDGNPYRIDVSTAQRLHLWAQDITDRRTRAGETPPQAIAPVLTEYAGITFRSKLEARWAYYFDSRNIPWTYEPNTFQSWIPDFRICLNQQHVWVEVKPIAQFPIDVAHKLRNAAPDHTTAILGNAPEHAWIYDNDGWQPLTWPPHK